MPAPTIPTLTPAPDAPLRSQAPATFTPAAEAFVDWQGDFPTEMNAVIAAIAAMAAYMEGLTGSSGPITATALTMATNRLLGRYSADTGAIEEISLGDGLDLTGGVLDLAATPLLTANDLSDLADAPTAQVNLGFIVVADQAAYDALTPDADTFYFVPEA